MLNRPQGSRSLWAQLLFSLSLSWLKSYPHPLLGTLRKSRSKKQDSGRPQTSSAPSSAPGAKEAGAGGVRRWHWQLNLFIGTVRPFI